MTNSILGAEPETEPLTPGHQSKKETQSRTLSPSAPKTQATSEVQDCCAPGQMVAQILQGQAEVKITTLQEAK